MKALTIKQPWASLIMFGGKDIENRDWAAPRWIIGQRIAIHSSKRVDLCDIEDAEDLCRAQGIQWPTAVEHVAPWSDLYLQGGVVLGTVLLVDCVQRSASPWFVGDYGFVLRDPQPFAKPIPARGQLGFWDWEGGPIR